MSAWFSRLFLESSPGEATYVLGGLNSLISTPVTEDHISPYSLFHKSLTDFLKNPSRCKHLYVQDSRKLYSLRYLEIWKSKPVLSVDSFCRDMTIACIDKGPATILNAPEMEAFLEAFLAMYAYMPSLLKLEPNSAMYDIAWWVHSQDECIKRSHEFSSGGYLRYAALVQNLFLTVHDPVSKTLYCFQSSLLIAKLRFSVASGGDAAQLAGTSERVCSKSFESSVGRLQAGCSCCALDLLIPGILTDLASRRPRVPISQPKAQSKKSPTGNLNRNISIISPLPPQVHATLY